MTDFVWTSIESQIAEEEDAPWCDDCGHEADMYTEGRWMCDACDDARTGASQGNERSTDA